MSTTAGDIEVKIPKLRFGSFFLSLLERRRRIDRALHAVIMEAYVHGISTRSADDLVTAMGVQSGVSKSEVSRICAGLDEISGVVGLLLVVLVVGGWFTAVVDCSDLMGCAP